MGLKSSGEKPLAQIWHKQGSNFCKSLGEMERAKGFEPSTSTLARLRSTRLSYARFRQDEEEP